MHDNYTVGVRQSRKGMCVCLRENKTSVKKKEVKNYKRADFHMLFFSMKIASRLTVTSVFAFEEFGHAWTTMQICCVCISCTGFFVPCVMLFLWCLMLDCTLYNIALLEMMQLLSYLLLSESERGREIHSSVHYLS